MLAAQLVIGLVPHKRDSVLSFLVLASLTLLPVQKRAYAACSSALLLAHGAWPISYKRDLRYCTFLVLAAFPLLLVQKRVYAACSAFGLRCRG